VTLLRRLSYLALFLAFAQIVFGAIVRITGSGMGCGDHWPTCEGYVIPPLSRPDLIIEVTHRYLAATVTVAIALLLVAAYLRRRERGVGGPGGVLRSAGLAAGLVLTAAVFGGITVKLSLNPYVIATHLAIAMTLLAVLSLTVLRAGGWGFDAAAVVAPRTYRAARAAVVLAFIVVVFGALTANVAGANNSCQGFPWCRYVEVHGMPLAIQITHRILAFLLFFHLLGGVIATTRRGGAGVVGRAAWVAFVAVVLQLAVAAVLVESHLPPVWRSLHQATGTLVWLSIFTYAALARYALPAYAPAAARAELRAASATPTWG
jgi:heme A synthase